MPDPTDTRPLGERVRRTIVDCVMTIMTRSAARTTEHMIVPGGRTSPVQPDKLTTRSGRLLRAIIGASAPQRDAGGRFLKGGTRESSFEVTASGSGSVLGLWTIDIPYAALHEYGGQLAAYTILMTTKMRAYLWARFYESREEKWKRAALRRGVTIPARTMPARPFIHPAIEDTLSERARILDEAIAREFGGAA